MRFYFLGSLISELIPTTLLYIRQNSLQFYYIVTSLLKRSSHSLRLLASTTLSPDTTVGGFLYSKL